MISSWVFFCIRLLVFVLIVTLILLTEWENLNHILSWALMSQAASLFHMISFTCGSLLFSLALFHSWMPVSHPHIHFHLRIPDPSLRVIWMFLHSTLLLLIPSMCPSLYKCDYLTLVQHWILLLRMIYSQSNFLPFLECAQRVKKGAGQLEGSMSCGQRRRGEGRKRRPYAVSSKFASSLRKHTSLWTLCSAWHTS